MSFQRYAIYYAPRPGDLARATAAWLGWDAQAGQPADPAEGMPLFPPMVTQAPRRYGFHGTLKAPFRLAEGMTQADLSTAVEALARGLPPVELAAMVLDRLGGFLALTPRGDSAGLNEVAAAVVQRLDAFRAPLTPDEIARRRPDRLSLAQRQNLDRWGYPHVLEEFRFHLTLTDDLPDELADQVAQALQAWLVPRVPRPFRIEDLCLFGEDAAGRFHLLSRHALTG